MNSNDFTIDDYAEAADYFSVDSLNIRDAASEYASAWSERLERELEGAWRAGFDYLHIYTDDEPALSIDKREPNSDPFAYTEMRYVFPTHYERPLRPDGVRYLYTYDLSSVPDHILRAAIRGELDDYERINTQL